MTDPLVDRLRAAGCVFAEDEAALLRSSARDAAELESLAVARVAGLPLEHVLGWVDFAGVRLRLGPGVFVPRPRSEFLVQVVAEALGTGGVLLDLCSGCGAIGLAAGARVDAEVHLAEFDPVAADWARINAVDRAIVHEGDLFAAMPDDLRGRVTVISVVAPYVPTDQIVLLPHEARDYEPRLALDGGDDGLEVLRRIAAEAPAWLSSGGVLLAEVGERQRAGAEQILGDAGLRASTVEGDDGESVVVGTFDPPTPSGSMRA